MNTKIIQNVRECKADCNTYRKQDDADNGCDNHRCILSVYRETESNREYDKQHGCRSNGTVCRASCKGICYDIRKCGDNKQQYEPCEYGKEHSALMSDVLFNNLTERFTLMTDGYEDRTEILNSAKEDTANHNP